LPPDELARVRRDRAAYAQTVVLVVFIGGMAIGAWVPADWVGVANRTVGTISSARQRPLWDAFLNSPCYAGLSPVHRDWLQLFAYTAARAAPDMASLGAKMLTDRAATTPRQWAYLITATATSQLATGQPEAARETIVRNWKYLDQRTRDLPTMELLLRLSQAQ
jgi:hypothetical protein